MANMSPDAEQAYELFRRALLDPEKRADADRHPLIAETMSKLTDEDLTRLKDMLSAQTNHGPLYTGT